MASGGEYLDVLFDGPPAHESGRFVEVNDSSGKSVNAGEWIDRGDGLWALRIPVSSTPPPDVIERAARVLTEALFKRSPYLSADQNDASKSDLYAQLRDSWVPTLAAAGLLTPSDTFASMRPSDAEHLLSVVETIKETGGSVQIRGVLITPCDTYGQPLTNVHPDADVDTALMRRAAATERAAERHWPADMLIQAADTIDALRTLHLAERIETEIKANRVVGAVGDPQVCADLAMLRAIEVVRRYRLVPAASASVSGYTSHGHRIPGLVQVGRPTLVSRCGGPGLCTACSRDALRATAPSSEEADRG